jgi:pimeloyl-ACP methyl ester carboxylesterase
VRAADGVHLDATLHRGGDAGAVLLAHGITADSDERGEFVDLADRLCDNGFTVLRFSFRGHGHSGGTPAGVTIAGERLDLRAAAAELRAETSAPLSIVAVSFGTVSTALSLPWLTPASLVLWNPVLDLGHTFLRPTLPVGVARYGQRKPGEGVTVHENFHLDGQLFDEFDRYDPRAAFLAYRCPALVIHGDRDEHVSYEIARDTALARPDTELRTITGAGHGFRDPEWAEEVVSATVEWLRTR